MRTIKKSLFPIIALFAVIGLLVTACKDDDPEPPATDTRVALTAVADQTGNSIAATVTAATAEFAGATGLSLEAGDFTITPTGATISSVQVDGNIATVAVAITAPNATATQKTFTVGIASSSTKIKGTATVVITQAGTGVPSNTPSITWGGDGFTETSANNGTVEGSVTATLINSTFTGTVGQPFTNYNTSAGTPIPSGLTLVATKTSNTLITFTFDQTTQALSHDANVSGIIISFTDAAFPEGIDAEDVNLSESGSLTITFDAPGEEQVELTANPASASVAAKATTATVTFDDAGGTLTTANLDKDADFIITEGTATITSVSADSGTVSVVIGFAANIDTTNPVVYTVGIDENSEVITGAGVTVTVTQAAKPKIEWGGDTGFTESNSVAKTFTGSVTAQLTGDTFVGGDGEFAAANYTVTGTGIPDDVTLVFTATKAGDTITFTLEDTSEDYDSDKDISDLVITFTDAAFTNSNAADVEDYESEDLTVTFN
ncbi:MAG: hypothetical protein LBQ77_08690 [Treponema sp.]|jgi:hypothetical protein|nr:hypothetical protein [Treponema sp.]